MLCKLFVNNISLRLANRFLPALRSSGQANLSNDQSSGHSAYVDTKLEEIEDRPQFPGSRSLWTSKLSFIRSDTYEGIPVFRLMNRDGEIIEPDGDPNLGQDKITKLYRGKVVIVAHTFCL